MFDDITNSDVRNLQLCLANQLMVRTKNTLGNVTFHTVKRTLEAQGEVQGVSRARLAAMVVHFHRSTFENPPEDLNDDW